MNEFESTNLVPATVIPYGAPDSLDLWEAEQEREDEDPTYDEEGPYLSDAEADAQVLAGAGWGTDEDYGFYGDDLDPPF